MFKKEENGINETLGKTNRIVEGTIITGTISTETDTRLDGTLIGDFKSKGKIVIGQTGYLKGDIICKTADIEGRFEGKIQVSELLNIKSKAVIIGEVICGKLAVEPGADFSATCIMKSNSKTTITNDGQQNPEETNQ